MNKLNKTNLAKNKWDEILNNIRTNTANPIWLNNEKLFIKTDFIYENFMGFYNQRVIRFDTLDSFYQNLQIKLIDALPELYSKSIAHLNSIFEELLERDNLRSKTISDAITDNLGTNYNSETPSNTHIVNGIKERALNAQDFTSAYIKSLNVNEGTTNIQNTSSVKDVIQEALVANNLNLSFALGDWLGRFKGLFSDVLTNASYVDVQYEDIKELLELNYKVKSGQIGQKGEKGDPGQNGINGINGINGRNGEKGEKGDPGRDGKDGVVVWSVSKGEFFNFDTVENLRGFARDFHFSEGLDFDIDGTKMIFRYGMTREFINKFSNQIITLQGTRGEQGPKGDPGENGAQGPKGDPGENASEEMIQNKVDDYLNIHKQELKANITDELKREVIRDVSQELKREPFQVDWENLVFNWKHQWTSNNVRHWRFDNYNTDVIKSLFNRAKEENKAEELADKILNSANILNNNNLQFSELNNKTSLVIAGNESQYYSDDNSKNNIGKYGITIPISGITTKESLRPILINAINNFTIDQLSDVFKPTIQIGNFGDLKIKTDIKTFNCEKIDLYNAYIDDNLVAGTNSDQRFYYWFDLDNVYNWLEQLKNEQNKTVLDIFLTIRPTPFNVIHGENYNDYYVNKTIYEGLQDLFNWGDIELNGKNVKQINDTLFEKTLYKLNDQIKWDLKTHHVKIREEFKIVGSLRLYRWNAQSSWSLIPIKEQNFSIEFRYKFLELKQ